MFYRTGVTEGRQQMVGLEVTADASISFRNQREMPIQPGLTRQGFRDFDITPDGERFVMVYPANETDTAGAPIDRIDIVLNWYEELLTRVPIP